MPKGVIMRPQEYNPFTLIELLEKRRVMTFDGIVKALGRPSRVTVFRKLAEVGGRASYSHRGRYQTLDRIAQYDDNGLWSFGEARFSRQGTLLRTIVHLVEHSREGYFASELQALLQVRVHNALARLYASKGLDRHEHVKEYLYVSAKEGAVQLEKRDAAIEEAHNKQEFAGIPVPDEITESMRLLLSVLNEKQRRLYLGFESIRLGHGGDAKISRITGVNVKTIALGRRQLQAGDVDVKRIREVGGGRPSVKKKRRDSTSG
jgi:hypothetical protein